VCEEVVEVAEDLPGVSDGGEASEGGMMMLKEWRKSE